MQSQVVVSVVVSCCKVHLTGCHTSCLLVAQFCWLRDSRFTSPDLCRFSMYFFNKIKHIGQILWGDRKCQHQIIYKLKSDITKTQTHGSYRGRYTRNFKGLFHVKRSLHLVQACIDFSLEFGVNSCKCSVFRTKVALFFSIPLSIISNIHS